MPNSSPVRDALDARILAAFRGALPVQSQVEPTLAAALSYALGHSGSMVRARVCYLLGRHFGLGEERAMDLAIAIELFHTASLLFDDLPCMDDALERRGAPCSHTKFGEGAAILAALALINRAYCLLWAAMEGCPVSVRTDASRFTERCLGLEGILNGQSYDLHFNRGDRQKVMRVAMGKTVSLIRLTLVLPAILGNASAAERKLLHKLSVFWGLAYQVMDDLKDVLSASLDTGKTTHRDGFLGRPNLALAIGPLRTTRLLTRLIALGDRAMDQAVEHLSAVDCLRELQRKIATELSPLLTTGGPQ